MTCCLQGCAVGHLLHARQAAQPNSSVLAVRPEQGPKAVGTAHGHDAADGPDIDLAAIACEAKEQLGRTVPPRGHILRQALPRWWKRPRKAKITELELAGCTRLTLDKQVLGLDVTVRHVACVAEVQRFEQLVDVCPRRRRCHAVGMLLEHLEQAAVDILKDEVLHVCCRWCVAPVNLKRSRALSYRLGDTIILRLNSLGGVHDNLGRHQFLLPPEGLLQADNVVLLESAQHSNLPQRCLSHYLILCMGSRGIL